MMSARKKNYDCVYYSNLNHLLEHLSFAKMASYLTLITVSSQSTNEVLHACYKNKNYSPNI